MSIGISKQDRDGIIPCVLCLEVKPLGYRSYDAQQVFVCDECDDKVEDEQLYFVKPLWDIAIERSKVYIEMHSDVREIEDDEEDDH